MFFFSIFVSKANDMARIELIKELKIRKDEIHSEIKSKFPELIAELSAIDEILGNSTINTPDNPIVEENTIGTPKGSMSWSDYVHFMLKEIGGKGKTRDVTNAIVKANSGISYARVKDACSDKLSRLLKEGKIKADKPQYKKEGYLYEIL